MLLQNISSQGSVSLVRKEMWSCTEAHSSQCPWTSEINYSKCFTASAASPFRGRTRVYTQSRHRRARTCLNVEISITSLPFTVTPGSSKQAATIVQNLRIPWHSFAVQERDKAACVRTPKDKHDHSRFNTTIQVEAWWMNSTTTWTHPVGPVFIGYIKGDETEGLVRQAVYCRMSFFISYLTTHSFVPTGFTCSPFVQDLSSKVVMM